jgi:hypothetical protein
VPALEPEIYLFPHAGKPSKVLNSKARVDLDVLARDARVLGQRNKHIRAVLEVRLWN